MISLYESCLDFSIYMLKRVGFIRSDTFDVVIAELRGELIFSSILGWCNNELRHEFNFEPYRVSFYFVATP